MPVCAARGVDKSDVKTASFAPHINPAKPIGLPQREEPCAQSNELKDKDFKVTVANNKITKENNELQATFDKYQYAVEDGLKQKKEMEELRNQFPTDQETEESPGYGSLFG